MFSSRSLLLSFVAIFPLLSSDLPFASSSDPFLASGKHNGRMIVSRGRPERLLADNLTQPLALAAQRTYRKDPLDDFHKYTGGWNISNRHYWASVAYTAIPFFVVAIIWFAVFGLSLSLICLCYCCCRREPYGYSRIAYALSLIFLVFFTIVAINSEEDGADLRLFKPPPSRPLL